MNSRVMLAGLAAFSLAAVSANYVAVAQEPPPPPPGAPHGWSHGPREHEAMFEQHCADLEAHHAAMRAFAYVKLHITEGQKAAWAAFEDKSKQADAPLLRICEAYKGKPEPQTLPDKLARMDAMAAGHSEHIHLMVAATQALYTQLTPEQKAEADHLLAGDHEGHPPGMWGHHGMEDHEHHGPPMPPDGKPGMPR